MVDLSESVRTANRFGSKCLPLMAMATPMTTIKPMMTMLAMYSASGTRVRTNSLRFPAPDFFSFAMNLKLRTVPVSIHQIFTAPQSGEVALGAADDFRVVRLEMAAVAQRGEIRLAGVAMFGRQFQIIIACFGIAVLLVVGDEPRDVLECKFCLLRKFIARGTAGAHRAAAGQNGFFEQFHVRQLERLLVAARGGGAVAHLIHIVNHIADDRNARGAPHGLQHGLMRSEA